MISISRRISISRSEPWEWAITAAVTLLAAALAGLALYSALKDSWNIEITRTLAASPETVHSYLVDPEKRVAWEPGVIDTAGLTGEPTRAGATRMLYMRSDGRRWHQFEELKASLPGERWAVRREGPNADREVTVRLAPSATGSGTRLVWREEITFNELEKRILGLWELSTRRGELQRGFDRLEWLALKGETQAESQELPR